MRLSLALDLVARGHEQATRTTRRMGSRPFCGPSRTLSEGVSEAGRTRGKTGGRQAKHRQCPCGKATTRAAIPALRIWARQEPTRERNGVSDRPYT